MESGSGCNGDVNEEDDFGGKYFLFDVEMVCEKGGSLE